MLGFVVPRTESKQRRRAGAPQGAVRFDAAQHQQDRFIQMLVEQKRRMEALKRETNKRMQRLEDMVAMLSTRSGTNKNQIAFMMQWMKRNGVRLK